MIARITKFSVNVTGSRLFQARFINKSYRYRGKVHRSQTQIKSIILTNKPRAKILLWGEKIWPLIILKK